MRDNSLNFDYNFLLDQNLKESNFNEILTSYDTNNIKFNFNYLEDIEKTLYKNI